MGVVLHVEYFQTLHDREIQLSPTGWVIKIGCDLDIYKPPAGKLCPRAFDLDLRKCQETIVDIFPKSMMKMQLAHTDCDMSKRLFFTMIFSSIFWTPCHSSGPNTKMSKYVQFKPDCLQQTPGQEVSTLGRRKTKSRPKISDNIWS